MYCLAFPSETQTWIDGEHREQPLACRVPKTCIELWMLKIRHPVITQGFGGIPNDGDIMPLFIPRPHTHGLRTNTKAHVKYFEEEGLKKITSGWSYILHISLYKRICISVHRYTLIAADMYICTLKCISKHKTTPTQASPYIVIHLQYSNTLKHT